MNIEVLKFDNNGRGIGYLNDKIIFISKAVPGDIIDVKITLEKKNYLEGKISKIIKPSKSRKNVICPYFDICGGCDLMHISLSDALEYKLNKINEILQHNKIDYNVEKIFKSDKQYNYRNKISLKIVNKEIGFYENSTHELVNIDYCYLCNEEINNLIKDLKIIEINNGNITIRSNYKNELLIIIDTKDEVKNIDILDKKYKLAGVIVNDKTILGSSFFLDKINDYLFKVSYNSFFQVNPYICSKLFDLIEEYTKDSSKVLDLYCGVGTLSIVASTNASYVLGIEILENAIKDANLNKNFNNKSNIEFICDDTKNILDKITGDFDTIILDPPRNGVNKNVLEKIENEKINKIIYVSCNPITLVRDLNLLLDSYKIEEFILLDMFVNSEHVESVCVLNRR